MKALRVNRLSDDLSGLELGDHTLPTRKQGEVLVEVKAASLNYPDLLMTQGQYQFKPNVPFIAGMEMAGIVLETDEGSPFKPGDKVLGGNKTGGFAELACIPEQSLTPLPSGLSFAEGAAMGAAYQTAYTGLVELCGLKPGNWALVTGASGGVGLAAIDLAKAMGAKVIAATGIEGKTNRIAKLYTPDAVIVSDGRFREVVTEITDGKLCDIVFDPVGGGYEDALAGRVIFIGDADARLREDYLRILRFFRFNAWYGADIDADGLAACARQKEGLRQIAAERIWKELHKLLSAISQ